MNKKKSKLTYKSPFFFIMLSLFLIATACDSNVVSPDEEVVSMETEAAFAKPVAVSAPVWSASGQGTVTLLGDGVTANPSMSYSINPAGFSARTWELSTTANKGGTVSLPYEYSGFHAFFAVRVFAVAFVSGSSGTTTTPLINAGPVSCCTSPSAGFSYSGNVTLTVEEGDTYGFRFGGSNGDSNNQLNGTFTVNFNNPNSKDQCKVGGWEAFGFKNQGQCVRYVETGKDSR